MVDARTGSRDLGGLTVTDGIATVNISGVKKMIIMRSSISFSTQNVISVEDVDIHGLRPPIIRDVSVAGPRYGNYIGGSYYDAKTRNHQFWDVNKDRPVVRIRLKNESYDTLFLNGNERRVKSILSLE